MSDSPLLSVEPLHLDGSATIALVGEFDLTGIDRFREVVHPLLARYDAARITFDCSRLRFIGGGGLSELVLVSARAGGGTLRLTGASELMVRLLQVTKTAHLFDVGPAASRQDVEGAAPIAPVSG